MIKKLLVVGGCLATLLILVTVAVQLWLGSDAIRLAVERQASTALGMPVTIGGASATVVPRLGIDLRDVQIGEPATTRVERLSIATGFGLLVDRRVEDADMRLSGGHISADIIAALGGLATARLPVESGALTLVSIRSIRFSDVAVVVGNEKIATELAAALDGDRLEVSSLTFEIGGATVRVDGAMSSLARLEGEFAIRSQTLPLDELVAVVNALTAGADTKGGGRPFRITAVISAPTAMLGGLKLESFE